MPFVAYVRSTLLIFEREAAIVPDKITHDQSHALKAIEEASQAVQTPLARVEHALLRPVNFIIVPLFALANAGVDLRTGGAAALASPVTWGIVLGLVLGKPIGIVAAAWASVRTGIASLPESVTWMQIFGISVLCGIGFTMSLFIANLAFAGSAELLADAKLGILAASVVAGMVGCVLIRRSTRLATPSA
jgi:NhaA family Na+:H+ antiporter